MAEIEEAGPQRAPLWVKALAITLGMQTVASFLDQSLAVIAPLMTRDTGIAPERIGNITSLSALGVVLFLLFGGPFLARLGPVRMLQVGGLMTVIGLFVVSSGWSAVLVPAAIMMGMGYGPTPPAGSRILYATAPAGHRTLIFSVKQAGAPFGGMLAGLVLAPVAAALGWQVALGLSMTLGIVAVLTIAPMRALLDVERDPTRSLALSTIFSPRMVAQPFRTIARNPTLISIVSLGFSFAIVQGSLFSFTVTYLVTDRHLAIGVAGTAYAAMQFSGVCARILLGHLADRSGNPALFLACQGLVAAVAVLGVDALPENAGLAVAALACGAAGFFGASWNGIFLAEVARHSDADQIAEIISASTVAVFCGYVVGPTLFSALVGWTAGYALPFALIAGQLAAMASIQFLAALRRRTMQRG